MLYLFLNLVLLIPPVYACIRAVFGLKGICARQRKMILVVFVPILLTYFVIQTLLVCNGHYPCWGASLLHHIAAALLIPLAYMMIRKSLDVTSGSRVHIILFSLLVLLIPDVIMQVMTPFDAELPTAEPQNNYIMFHVTPQISVRHSIFSFVVEMQVAIVVTRVLEMRRILISRGLYLSENGRTFVFTCFACCAWVVLSLCPSQKWLQNHHEGMLAINAVYCVFVTTIVLMIGKYFGESIVVNAENELVDIENDVDSELAEALRLAIERDKVYLNSALHIEEFSAMLSTNRTYVARACRLKFGMTFTELMNKHRVDHSKELLVNNPRMRIEDVAAGSGFSSASFFSKVFKSHEGCTPTQWRQDYVQKKSGVNPSKSVDSSHEVNDANRGG